MKLRIGVIGLGDAWENRHRLALRALGDRFEVRAICCEVMHLAQQAARELGAEPVEGFRTLTSREDIDAVFILSPEWYGHLPILAACEAGKAIYCAAALDIGPEQAREIRQRVHDSGVAFMAELPRRLYPATIRLKELIATRLGKPRLLFCHSRVVVEGKKNEQRRPYPLAVRNLMELVDWCRYVVGEEPTSVMGVRHHIANSTDDDYHMMSLDFSPPGQVGSGALAQISCGHYMPAAWHEAISFRPPAGLQVSCENGIAFIDPPSSLVYFDAAGRHMESLETERPVGEQLLTHFHRAVTSLVRKTSDLEDAYRALQIVLAARTSFQESCRVNLEI